MQAMNDLHDAIHECVDWTVSYTSDCGVNGCTRFYDYWGPVFLTKSLFRKLQ